MSLLCAAFLFASSPPARADQPTTQPAGMPSATADSIKKWFTQLSDADPGVRDRASERLMQLKRDDLQLLRNIVQEELPLAPMQIEALPEIVNQVYLSGEQYDADQNSGFLGVQTDPELVPITTAKGAPEEPERRGILVVNRVPGFCAARSLRNGDVILRLTDSPDLGFVDFGNFSEAVRKHPAGDTIRLQILRRGQVCEVAITLNPRPAQLSVDLTLSDFAQRRQQAFQEYWDANFAPLLKEEISSTDSARTATSHP